MIVGLDGGYVRSRHRRPERNFEVIAGKVIGPGGEQHRFAFARNSSSAEPFARALARVGISSRTPATVLSDGDAGVALLGMMRFARQQEQHLTVRLSFHDCLKWCDASPLADRKARRNQTQRCKQICDLMLT